MILQFFAAQKNIYYYVENLPYPGYINMTAVTYIAAGIQLYKSPEGGGS